MAPQEAHMAEKPKDDRQNSGARGRNQGAAAIDRKGRVDEAKLEQNRKRLNVDKDHRTPDMKKGHRGTFP
jgi:hypothetical protein